jgi:hypothetical protein
MDRSIVDKLSGTSEFQRDKLYRWFGDQGDSTRWEAAKMQGELAMRNRAKYDKAHRAEFYYAMHVRAVFKLHWLDTAQARKVALTSEEAKALSARRVQRIKELRQSGKQNFKKDIIRSRFYELIKSLRVEGLSWQKVIIYIEKYHRMKFSLSYLKKTYEDLENERIQVEAEA